ncbi:DUF2244 domain-containing protein [Paracoccus sp. TK19116]|uniref:DUF2244 domain-containing protein n=1 Tax=Paracoccus albicereus TaxID=2922394 RepID=A0ABT1MV50_9RHOB|nr:DUF2244 domain-containing protein [Paracoccus albicereus]MCQ0971163.1 DUF2244 domain-containing protein [Paracoccus albicereus]
MPYSWSIENGAQVLRARPHRSLPRKGFVWFIGITAVLFLLPLMAVVGTVVLWGLLPFIVIAVAGVWIGLERTYRTGRTTEILHLTRDSLDLRRSDAGRDDRIWHANPYWVRAILRRGPVESYLTLTDGQRELELGSFLTPDERRSLHDDLLRRLADLR